MKAQNTTLQKLLRSGRGAWPALVIAAALSGGAGVAFAGPFAYVPNTLPASVSVIDTATNQISATVAFPSMSNPFAAAITPDLKKVYVTGQNSVVFDLDTATNTITGGPIAVGGLAAGIAITPDGKHAYVVTQYTSTLYVIDTDTDTVSATIAFPAGTDLQCIAITPDGQRAYVTAKAANSVFVVDTSTNSLLGTPISVGSAPEGIAITPDGKEIYVTHDDATAVVSVIDTASNNVVASIPASPWLFGVTFTPDGKLAYATGGGGVGYTLVIDTTTRGIVVTIPQGGNAVAITSDGKQAYLPAADTVSVLDTTTNMLVATISGLNLANNVSVRPLPAGIAVPSVVGSSQSAATSTIDAAGLTVGTVTPLASSTVVPGVVISQDPAADAFVGSGAAISLTVSSGVAVPDVTSKAQAAATTAITAAGLVVGTVAKQSSNTVAAGTVISQNPTAGTRLAGGAAVSLVVSSGSASASGGGGEIDALTQLALLCLLIVSLRRAVATK